jgi:hypothetical protein
MAAWPETEKGYNRLLLESELLANDFPQMSIGRTPEGEVVVYGELGPGGGLSRNYYIEALYPHNYGNGNPIDVYLPEEEFPWDTPHLYSISKGHICIHHGNWDRNCTISDAFGWTRAWLQLYEEFRTTGARW